MVQLLKLGNQRRINGAYCVSQKHVTNDIRLHTSEINNPVNCKTGELQLLEILYSFLSRSDI